MNTTKLRVTESKPVVSLTAYKLEVIQLTKYYAGEALNDNI